MKHQKILSSNSGFLINGEHTKSITVPLIDQGIQVKDSLFSNCIIYNSNGGAISCYITRRSFYNPIFKIESSTFHECYTLSYEGKGGALYIQGYSLLSQNNCFSSCSSAFGVFCHYTIQSNFDCHINQSTFHTNSKPGIGEGSVIISTDHLLVVDNNFTNINIGGDGSGLITTVSEKYCISRNVFKNSEGKSVIFIDTIPFYYIFQLLNFINDIEQGNGIISISNNFMISKCFFYHSGPVLINSEKGSTFLYQCIFDSFLKSSNSIFRGSFENKNPSYDGNNEKIRFGIHNNLNTVFCLSESSENFIEIFTPTKTPYFYKFSPNPADIVILSCIGVFVIFLIFTIVYFLWYFICSKPSIRSSIKYLKMNCADINDFKSISYSEKDENEYSDYSEPDFDEENENEKKKKQKERKKKNKKKNSKKKKKEIIILDDEEEEDENEAKSYKNKKNKDISVPISIDDISEDEPEKGRSKSAGNKKSKSKKKTKNKNKNKKDLSDDENDDVETNKKDNMILISEPESENKENLTSDHMPDVVTESNTNKGMPAEPEPEIEIDSKQDSDVETTPKKHKKHKKKNKSKSKQQIEDEADQELNPDSVSLE